MSTCPLLYKWRQRWTRSHELPNLDLRYIRSIFLLIVSPIRIQTWALEEAQRRLEKEGILEDKSGQ